MILVPIAVVFLCLSVMQAWRKHWKNATLHMCAAVITLLTYALWAQSHVTDFQRKRMDEQATQITELIHKLTEAENRTTDSTVPSEGAPSDVQ